MARTQSRAVVQVSRRLVAGADRVALVELAEAEPGTFPAALAGAALLELRNRYSCSDCGAGAGKMCKPEYGCYEPRSREPLLSEDGTMPERIEPSGEYRGRPYWESGNVRFTIETRMGGDDANRLADAITLLAREQFAKTARVDVHWR